MKTSEVLERALALIPDEQHWIQGMAMTADGRYCLVGAIKQAAPGMSTAAASATVLAITRRHSHHSDWRLTSWNDRKHRKYADVRRVLEQAIARAQAEEASRDV